MKTKAYLNILIATIFFSSMEVAIKYTNGVFNPIQLNFVRFLVGGIILMPFALKKLKKFDYKLTKSDYLKFAFLGDVWQVPLVHTAHTLAAVKNHHRWKSAQKRLSLL